MSHCLYVEFYKLRCFCSNLKKRKSNFIDFFACRRLKLKSIVKLKSIQKLKSIVVVFSVNMPTSRRNKRKIGNNKRTQAEANLIEPVPSKKRRKIDSRFMDEEAESHEGDDEGFGDDDYIQDVEELKIDDASSIINVKEEEDEEPIFGAFEETDIHGEHEQVIEIDDVGPFLKETCSLNFLVIHIEKKVPKSNTGKNILELVVTDCTKRTIKILCWEEKAIEFGQLKEGKHYKLTNFRVRKNSVTFQVFNQFYLMATMKSEIVPLTAAEIQAAKLPKEIEWKFTKLKDVMKLMEQPVRCTVIGVIVDVGDVTPFSGLYAKQATKREIKIMDETGSCSVTLWNQSCDLQLKKYQIVVIAGGKPSEWNEVSLTNVGFVKSIPKHPASIRLQKWLKKLKPKVDETPVRTYLEELEAKHILGNLKTFSEARDVIDDVIFSSELQTKYCLVMGRISEIDPYNMFYEKNGTKFKIQLTIKDEFDNKLKLTAFDDVAQKIFKTSAPRVQQIQMQDPKKFAVKMKELVTKQKPKVFRVQIRKNEYFGRPDAQLILLQIKPANAVLAKKTRVFSKSTQNKNLPKVDDVDA